MNTKDTRAESGLPVRKKQNTDPSRRRFLQAAAVGAVAVTVPIVGITKMQQPEAGSDLEDPMEIALKRYGSELGNLKRIG